MGAMSIRPGACVFLLLSILCLLGAAAQDSQPRFLSVQGVHQIHSGGTVVLPCRVENLGDDYAVYWKKENDELDVLVADTDVMTADRRFSSDHPEGSSTNWDLRITNVEPYDQGVYRCMVSTSPEPMVQQQSLDVRVPPSVNVKPDRGPYSVMPGDLISLQCSASGNPLPTVTWRKLEGPLPNGRASFEGQQFHHPNAKIGDSGTYECRAENSIGQSATARIVVRVHSGNVAEDFSPWVTTERNFVPVHVGDPAVHLTCKYDANPLAQVDWIFNGMGKIPSEEEGGKRTIHNTRKDNLTETTLTIRNVSEEDFGDFVCRVHNNLGEAQEKILVSGKPGPARMRLWDADEPLDSTIALQWTLVSLEPVLKYEVQYRADPKDRWTKETLDAKPEDQNGDEWSSRHVIRKLKQKSKYFIQVRGQNRHGWGPMPDRGLAEETNETPAIVVSPNPTQDSSHSSEEDKTSGAGGVGWCAGFASLVLMFLVV